ncbi:1405_t:CDS:2 [Entrophospora sp. SA101]|nr:1405_t:CDS:2 [Entrophospora sp. SA101]
MGTMKEGLDEGKHNKFYGSFESYKDLTELRSICIEATDIDSGLEYLPISLVKRTMGGVTPHMSAFECLPHTSEAKFKPEYFTNLDSKDKWIRALKNKLEESKKELSETDKEKVKRITRLESKIQELEKAKTAISQQTQTRFQTQDKSTQTDLNGERIQQLLELEEQIKQIQLHSKNNYLNYITFVNRPPFNRLKEGEYITVKTEMLVGHPTNSIFDNTEMITLGYFGTDIDSSKFEIKRGSYYGKWNGEEYETHETKIIPCQSVQTYLNQNYPKDGTCLRKDEEGNNHEDFGKTRAEITKKLKKIYCSDNQLTTLNLSNCKQLNLLNFSDNYLTQIVYPRLPSNLEKITELNISNNNFSTADLTIFSQMRNLGWLYIEYLPVSLEEIKYDTKLRPNCQLAHAKTELEQAI